MDLGFCDLPTFVTDHYNQTERCSWIVSASTPTPTIVWVAMAVELLKFVAFGFAIWQLFQPGYSRYGCDHVRAWPWWLCLGLFAVSAIASQLTACL
jgi:hypothetical protein